MILNNTIQDSIINQINNLNNNYYQYNIDSHHEIILVKIENSNIYYGSHEYTPQGILNRLNAIKPFIHSYVATYKPKDFIFRLFLGDIIDTDLNIPPVLCFSKTKQTTNGILIPNIDFIDSSMTKYFKITIEDIPFNSKNNSSIFIGSSTGQFENNTRVLYCGKCLNNTRHKAYINNLCQNSHEQWKKNYPFINQCLHKSIPIQEQLRNKIVINIDGNSLCYSRLYWQIMSNSVPVYIAKNTNYIEFFDHFDNSNTYISVSLDDSLSILDIILDSYSKKQIDDVNQNGKDFYIKYFKDYHNNANEWIQDILNLTLDRLSEL